MGRRLLWLGAVVVAAALLLFVTHRAAPAAGRPAAAAGRPAAAAGGAARGPGAGGGALTSVSVGPVVQGAFTASLSLTGTVSAKNQVQVEPQVSGKVATLGSDIGQQVKAGQTLATIDDGGTLEQAVASAQAQVTAAKQTVNQAQQSEAQSHGSLAQAKTQLASAEAQLQQLEHPSEFITSTQLTQAQLAVKSAEASLAQQQTSLTAAQQAMTLTAPAGGFVEYESVTVGQNLSPGQTVMVIVPPGSPVQVQAQVQQQSNFDLQVGDAASVNIPAANGIFAGTVTAIGNGASSSSSAGGSGGSGGGKGQPLVPSPALGSVNVTITLSNASSTLRDGMTGEINIFGGPSPVVSQTVQATGTVQYANDWAVIAPQGGTVAQLAVGAGDDVTTGQTVAQMGGATLDATLTKAKQSVQQAQVQVDQAKASLQALQSPPTGAQPAIAAAQQAVASDQQSIASDQQAIQAQQRTIAGDQQVVADDEQQLALKQQQLSELTVTAPFDGVITARDVSVGAQVSPSTPLFTLQGQVMEVQVPVPQQDVGRVKLGDTASLVPAGSGGTAIPGRVETITPAATAQSLTFTVYVLPDKASPLLQPGAAVAAMLVTEQLSSALVMPAQAVQTINGKQQVFVVQNGVLALVPVTLGVTGTAPGVAGTAQVVSSGLKAGDQVVTSDPTYLAPGDHVRVTNLTGTPQSAAGGAGKGKAPVAAGGKPGAGAAPGAGKGGGTGSTGRGAAGSSGTSSGGGG